MKIPTWKVGSCFDKDNPELWREYEAHTVDDAVKMFIHDTVPYRLKSATFLAQCTNYGEGAILKVEVEAVPQITYKMTVEPL